jgi:hypothetical protein
MSNQQGKNEPAKEKYATPNLIKQRSVRDLTGASSKDPDEEPVTKRCPDC